MEVYITDYGINPPQDTRKAVLEDSIMHINHPVTAGSKMLENFISPIDATVIKRLEAAQVSILGKTKMDEFGIGTAVSGSPDILSGAVAAVAGENGSAVDFALCNDFSGKVRRQAAERGVFYIHPTYGTVSRYGLIPAIPSMDQIGIVCKNFEDGFWLLSRIAGNDPGDGAMFPDKEYAYSPDKSALKLGVPVNVMAQTADKSKVEAFVKSFEITEFELEYFNVYSQVMYILSCAEISNNLTRYDGIKFGYRTDSYRGLDELYKKSRTEGFGFDAKLTAIMGAFVLSQDNYMRYYDKAMRIRRLIRDSLRFDRYDVIVLPAWSEVNPFERSALYALAQLAGLPSVSVPFEGGAVQLITNVKNENALYSALKAVEL